jgi:hypothetical protein
VTIIIALWCQKPVQFDEVACQVKGLFHTSLDITDGFPSDSSVPKMAFVHDFG